MISEFLSGCKGKSFGAPIFFSGASQDENFCDFPLRSDGWKDLMMGKTSIYKESLFIGASIDENIFTIATGENS